MIYFGLIGEKGVGVGWVGVDFKSIGWCNYYLILNIFSFVSVELV